MIYRLNTPDGPAYGCPVEVWFAGQRRLVLYRFPGDAVLDVKTGAVLAAIPPDATGYPQERAQRAVQGATLPGGPVRNVIPSVVGVMRHV